MILRGTPPSLARSQPAKTTLLALLATVLTVGCGGKGVAGNCPDLPACGGNPEGVWKLQSMCEFREAKQPLLAVPVPSAYASPQTPALAGPPPSATTSGDWCSGLIYLPPSAAGSGTVGNVQFFAKPLAFVKGNVAFLHDNTYSVNIFGASPEITHFTRSCLNAYGANPTCSELEIGLNAQPLVNYVELTCGDSTDGGCDCIYKLAETAGDIGVWAADNNTGTLVEYPSTGTAPQIADYCVNGDTLTMSGKNGAHLNASSGRRSFIATKCADPSCGETAAP